MLTPEQKEARRHGIGGSDAAAILGVSPWSSPFDVYMRLTGVDVEEVEAERLDWGNILEPVIRAEYVKRTGRDVGTPQITFRHPERPWMIANVDGFVRPVYSESGEVKPYKGLEIKTVGTYTAHHWGPSGTDEIPDYYLPQVAHYMAVLNVDEFDVAAFFGDFSMRIYTVRRDLEFEAVLLEEEAAFWQRVQDRNPPPIDGSEGAKAWLRSRYPRDERPVEDATANERELVEELRWACDAADAAERTLALAQNRVIEAIADRGGIKCDIGTITYKANKKGTRSLRKNWSEE